MNELVWLSEVFGRFMTPGILANCERRGGCEIVVVNGCVAIQPGALGPEFDKVMPCG